MPKLVLHSDQVLPASKEVDERMLALIGRDRPKIGYLPSSSDPDRRWFQACQDYYSQYQIALDLYFGLDQAYDPSKLDSLMACDAIHLSGGNTYLFRHRLSERNMFESLLSFAAKGGVLIGVSAGAILMTSHISTSLLCGDMPVTDAAEDSGLSLVEFGFVPHVGKYGIGVQELFEYSVRLQTTVYGCPDGAGIVVDDDQIECIGDVIIATEGIAL